jgi:hypothetical protein
MAKVFEYPVYPDLAVSIYDIYQDKTYSGRAQKMKWIYHAQLVASGATQLQFFATKGALQPDRANFWGDMSLVAEDEFAVVHALRIRYITPYPANSTHVDIPAADKLELADNSYYEFKVAGKVIDDGKVRDVMGGFDITDANNPNATTPIIVGAMGDGRHDNIHLYVPPFVVPGGRMMDFWWRCPNGLLVSVADGLVLEVAFKVVVCKWTETLSR